MSLRPKCQGSGVNCPLITENELGHAVHLKELVCSVERYPLGGRQKMVGFFHHNLIPFTKWRNLYVIWECQLNLIVISEFPETFDTAVSGQTSQTREVPQQKIPLKPVSIWMSSKEHLSDVPRLRVDHQWHWRNLMESASFSREWLGNPRPW